MSQPRRLGLWIPWTLFALLVAGWLIYWNITASTARARIAEWAAAENLAGGSASVGAVRTHGFPAMLRLEISDVSRRPAGAEWTATTARIDMHINLTAPGHYILEAKAPISVTRANGARMLIEADALLMSGREDGGSIIDQRIEADRLTIDDPSADGVLSVGKLVIGERPDPRALDDTQIAITARDIHLPRPTHGFATFGQNIASLRAGIVLTRAPHGGEVQSFQPDRLIHTRVEALAFNWGPLDVRQGAGEVRLDVDGRIEGGLELEIANPGPALAALAQDQTLLPETRATLQALAQAGAAARASLSAEDGALLLDGARLRDLAPLY